MHKQRNGFGPEVGSALGKGHGGPRILSFGARTLVLGVVLIFWTRSAHSQVFEQPLNLSNTTASSGQPQIASFATNVYAVWSDQSPGNFDIFCSVSGDEGHTFSGPIGPPLNLSNSPGDSTSPQIAADSHDNIYVVWQESVAGTNTTDIFLTRSNNGGQTLSVPVDVSNSPETSEDSPQIAIDKNGDVSLVWSQGTGSAYDAFSSGSTDGGDFLNAPRSLKQLKRDSARPSDRCRRKREYQCHLDWERPALHLGVL